MIALIIFLVGLFVALGVGVLACQSDYKGLTIPNMHSAIIAGAFVVCYALMWLMGRDDVFMPFLSHILAGLIVFGVTLGMYAMKGLGAADSKLATAYALWVGLKGLLPFLFYMALVGGVLGGAALLIRRYKPFKAPAEGSWIARVQAGESKVPYGIAIVLGALASFVKLGYLGSEVFTSFLL